MPASSGLILVKRHRCRLMRGAAALLLLVVAACEGPPSMGGGDPPAAPDVRVPRGYLANLFVPPGQGVIAPTALAFGPDGRLYVSELTGMIKAISDPNRDGTGERIEVFATGFASPLGLAFAGNDLFVSSNNRLTRLRNERTGAIGTDPTVIAPDLHAQGQHQNDHVAIGPDGKVYVAVGSVNNRGPQPHPYNASLLQVDPQNGEIQIVATGLRNAYGIAFDPQGTLWATDNGWDPPEDPLAPDELDRIAVGADYGFPRIAGQAPRGDPSRSPEALLPAHGAVTGLVFYNADLMPEFRGNAFVTLWGPQDRRDDSLQKVVRVEFGADGAVVSDFAIGPGMERPIAVTVGPTGHLFVADFHSGKIIRIGPKS